MLTLYLFNFGAKHGRPRCICSIDELLREEVFVCGRHEARKRIIF